MSSLASAIEGPLEPSVTVTISRPYDTHDDAQQAVRRLETAGVPHSDISMVANNSDNWFGGDKKVDRDGDGVDDRAEGAGKGAGIGAGVGGTAGLLTGFGLLAIPGPGPVVAAGWLRPPLARPREPRPAGLSEHSRRQEFRRRIAHSYAEGVRRGGTLVSARAADADRSRLDAVLNESAINLRERRAAWQKAWRKSFDPSSKPYGADEVRKERQQYGTLR